MFYKNLFKTARMFYYRTYEYLIHEQILTHISEGTQLRTMQRTASAASGL